MGAASSSSAVALAAVLASATGAGTAAAERAPRDVGLTFGGGVSMGAVDCDVQVCFQSRAAGIVDGHLGVMVAPRLAVLAEAWGTSYEVGDSTVTGVQGGLGVRAWPLARLWMSASVGLASRRVTPNLVLVRLDEIVGVAPGGTVGLGYEAYSSANLALDLTLRSAVVLDDGVDASALTVGVGASWY